MRKLRKAILFPGSGTSFPGSLLIENLSGGNDLWAGLFSDHSSGGFLKIPDNQRARKAVVVYMQWEVSIVLHQLQQPWLITLPSHPQIAYKLIDAGGAEDILQAQDLSIDELNNSEDTGYLYSK